MYNKVMLFLMIVITGHFLYLMFFKSDARGSVIKPPLQRRELCLEPCEYKASGIESLTGDGKFKSKRYIK